MYDIIIVGGGPAGMTAALYARRNGKTALVIEKSGFGGQITHSPKVENFPGTVTISGTELADSMMSQILEQGADIEIETVASIEANGDKKIVKTEEGGVYESYAVIIATGVKHRMLGLSGEEELVGEGISFCAVCDGDFYSGKSVLMAGGGNSALQEAILLSDKCQKVTMLQDLPYFTGEESLQKLLFSRDNVAALTGVKITDLITENGAFKGVRYTVTETGESKEIYADGLFVAIGLIPENEPFKNLAELNSYGYFDSDENCTTKTPGVFVAGDCRSKYIRQVTTAAADGTIAALAACRYVNEVR
ncbi:MAG: FAD-dependent oxidoreductase [Clostridia bacterium]|nr:FAD-dependent oxidoreductase [Clostridia bacterium]